MVASRVKSFCSVITAEDKIWDLLPYFVNLEALGLHGYWDEYDQVTYEVRSPPLAKLRFAKLLGYIPQAGARWILRSGPTLERLELGMLDKPIQATEGSDAGESDRNFTSLSEDNLDNSDEESDHERLNRLQAFPRPLSGFLPEEGVSLPILEHLYLCSPAHRKHTDDAQDEGWSAQAEEESSEDWIRILVASRWTLQTLVLEHKVSILNSEADARGEEECIRDFHTNNDGAGSSKLAEVLEAVGVYRVEMFPELTDVYFYGIVVSRGLDNRPSLEHPVGRIMTWLGHRGVRCEARRGQWFAVENEEGWTDWVDWDARSDQKFGSDDSDPHIRWDEVIASV